MKKKQMQSTVSDAVRELRVSLGESQQAFAYRMKSAIRSVARWESVRPPKAKTLAQLERIASENGQPQLAKRFQEALVQELQVPEFSFTIDTRPRNDEEAFHVSVLLDILRSPRYKTLRQDWFRLAAEPARRHLKEIRELKPELDRWQALFSDSIDNPKASTTVHLGEKS
jgi:transcriptional regulator with XRE-family HTH domain